MEDLEDDHWRNPTETQTLFNFKILGYVTLTCFAFGSLTYIATIAVLARKHMISPINTILIHYRTNVILAGFAYIPRTYHEIFRAKSCAILEHKTYAWVTISYYSFMVAATFRNFAVWMALMIGVWRYVAVIYPLKERRFCTMEVTKKVICFGYVLILSSVSIPLIICTGVGPVVGLFDQNGCATRNFSVGKNGTIYEFQIFIEDYPLWYSIGLVSFGVFVKLIPTCELAFISVVLITAIINARRRRRRMVIASGRELTEDCRMERQINRNKDRTTIMLLLILGLFVLGEVPLGIYCTLSGFYGPKFFWKWWYNHILEIVNSLTYVSEVFNFPVYYLMSRSFRETFKALFKNKKKPANYRKRITPQTSSSSLPGIRANPKEGSTSHSSSIATDCLELSFIENTKSKIVKNYLKS